MDGFSKEEMDLLWEAVEPIVAAAESDYHTSLRRDEEIKKKRAELEKLKDALQESESERKRLHNRIAELKGNIRVFCRVRPLSPDNEEGSPAIYFPTSLEYRGRTLVLKPQNGKRFTFDQVFNPEASQKEVYDEISQLVQSALDGYKVCIFAYGQTGSGKSYTMIGSLREKAERGLIPRSLEQIFEATESLVAQGWKYNIQVSMFEIYNETIRDLLSTETGSFSCIDVSSIAHVTSLFKQAARRRATGMTQMNETSSRSHFIFQIRLLGDNERSGEHVDGALNLIDLAGSDRVKKSGVAGDRLKETQAINTGLFYLSQVITALIKKQPVVPYTGSTLTGSLKDCLAAADAKMLMFVNVSPDSSSAAETSKSLEFAETVNACRIGRHKK